MLKSKMFTMGTLVAVLCMAVAGFDMVAQGQDRPTVGAIRWDAWTGGSITVQVEKTLGPKKYHNRLPWFAKVIDDNTVKIDGGRQWVMDREIELAANAGLDYWAFLIYAQDNVMSKGLAQYLQSKRRRQIGFCMILHNTLKSSEDKWPAERDRAIALMREPGYMTVLDGRPLVYAFIGQDFPLERFTELLMAAKKQGLNPYCVFMGWKPSRDFQNMKTKGFDAVSNYASGGGMATFDKLVRHTENGYWADAAKAKVSYVPMVTTGWDKNPRKDNPVSWEKDHPYHKQQVFPSRARPDEIASHLRRALAFVEKHPKLCPARTVIIYAWNEYDEGGWIAPTRGSDGKPDNGRLDAIEQVLKPSR